MEEGNAPVSWGVVVVLWTEGDVVGNPVRVWRDAYSLAPGPLWKTQQHRKQNQVAAITERPGSPSKKTFVFFPSVSRKNKGVKTAVEIVKGPKRSDSLVHLWCRRLCRPYRQSMWSAGPACWTRPTGPPPQRCGNGCTLHRSEPPQVRDPSQIACTDTQEKIKPAASAARTEKSNEEQRQSV